MFSTVMTTAGFTSVQEREAISNTVWFLSEHNDNFDPEVVDSEELVCPSNDNIDLKRGKRSVKYILLHFWIINNSQFSELYNIMFIYFRMQQLIPTMAVQTYYPSYCI